jgi:hypothetical protein
MSQIRDRHLKENLYVSNSAMMLPKNYPWKEDFNAAIAKIRAGGLIKYYWEEPLPLEMTLDDKVFTFVDDSQDKLTTDTFFLLFLFWAFGMLMAFVAITVEIIVFKSKMRNQKKKIRFNKCT